MYILVILMGSSKFLVTKEMAKDWKNTRELLGMCSLVRTFKIAKLAVYYGDYEVYQIYVDTLKRS